MILKSACLRNVSHKRSQLLNIKSLLHGKNCKNDIHGGDSFFESYDNRFSIDIISAQDFSFNDKYMLSKL